MVTSFKTHTAQTSPGTTRFFLHPSASFIMHYSVQLLGLIWVAVLPTCMTSYGDFCSSDQRFARELVYSSHPASFRFHLNMTPAAFGYILPTTGRIRDFKRGTCAAERRNTPAWTQGEEKTRRSLARFDGFVQA